MAERYRSARLREVRGRTESPRSMTKKSLAVINYPAGVVRPRTRGDCHLMERPCPFVSCRHHLFLDVNRNGGLLYNFPDLEPDQLVESCSLDVADLGPQLLEDVGDLMNITRERVRMIESDTIRKLQGMMPLSPKELEQ